MSRRTRNSWQDEFPVRAEDREFAAFQEIIERNLAIPVGEVRAHRRSFQRGYQRARQRIRDGPANDSGGDNLILFRSRRTRFWTAAAALLVAGLLVGINLVTRPEVQPGLLESGEPVYAVSGMFGGFFDQAPELARVRTETNQGLPLPGITVHHRSPAPRKTASLLATTAYAQGSTGSTSTTGDLVFRLNGAEIGFLPETELAGSDNLLRIALDKSGNLLTDRNTIEYAVNLQPGERTVLADNLEIALDAQSPTGWRGNLVHDLNWPAPLRYGNVVEGVLRLDGPATDFLYVTMAVSDDKLKLHTDDPTGLTVVAHHWDDPEPERHKSHWHRLDDVPSTSRLRQRNSMGQVIPGGRAITWQAESREDYALCLPLSADGQLVACTIYFHGSTYPPDPDDPSKPAGWRMMTVMDFERQQQDRWKGWFDAPDLEEYSTTTAAQSPFLLVGLDYAHEVPWGGREIILGDGIVSTDGTFRAERTDFTGSRPVNYGPVSVECPTPEGNYRLLTNPQTGLVELAGDLDLITGDLRWDIDNDGVFDGTGPSITVPLRQLQYRKIAVVFTETNGACLKIEDTITPPATDDSGFYGTVPMLLASRTQPVEEVHLLAMTENCQHPPYPPGTLACGRLIPYIVVEPTPQLLNRDLDRLTFTVNGSPAWGNPQNIYFDPYVFPARRVEDAEGLVLAFDNSYFQAQEHNKLFSFPNASIEALRILRWPDTNRINDLVRSLHPATNNFLSLEYLLGIEPHLDVLEYFDLRLQRGDYVRWDTFNRAWQIDIADPPAEDEIYRLLADFVETSDFFTYEHLTEHGQNMVFQINLDGRTHLTAGQYIVIGLTTETMGGMTMGQWDVYSGGANPASITITTADGNYSETWYMDFSAFTAE